MGCCPPRLWQIAGGVLVPIHFKKQGNVMKKLAMGIAVLAASALGACATDGQKLDAASMLTKDEVIALVSNSNYRAGDNTGFISADGKLSASNIRASSDGTWTVNAAGEYCNSWNNPQWTGSCGAFYRKAGASGVYLRPTNQGVVEYTITKKK